MGSQRGKEFYNKIFKSGGNNQAYFKEANEIKDYFLVWSSAYELIKKIIIDENIVDLGCGPGHFASLFCNDHTITYKGYDFSDEAINQAKNRNKNNQNLRFFLMDLQNDFPKEANKTIYTSFEFLEHVDFDLEIFNKLDSGTRFIFSVPNYDSAGHVRFFNDKRQIIDRYNKFCSFLSIKEFYFNKKWKIYLCDVLIK